MKKSKREELMIKIEFEVEMYNVWVKKLDFWEDIKSHEMICNRAKKQLHGIRKMLDVANLLDESYKYSLEYFEYGIYKQAKLIRKGIKK